MGTKGEKSPKVPSRQRPYFQDDPVGLVKPDLQPSLDEINGYLLRYCSTISGTNLLWSWLVAAMADVGDQKNRHIVHYCTKD